MLRFTRGTIEMSWDPHSRLAVLWFTEDTRARGPDAVALVDMLSGWLGTMRDPFALLGDGGRLRGVDAEYRAVWSRFFKQHRDQAFIAFFNMGPLLRVAAEMFRLGTGLRLKAFATEGEARAWLCQRGIGA